MRRIAIDCRPLVGHRTGIGRYLYELLRQFAERDDRVEYYLYSPAPIDIPSQCLDDRRFITRIQRVRPHILWLNVAVPLWMIQDQIDIFWGPNYAMPLLKLGKSRYVVTIHDATYARHPQTMRWDTRLHHKSMLPLYGRIADMVITDSFFSQSELADVISIDRNKIGVVHLASDIATASHTIGRISDKPYVLSVGTIEPRKNFECLIAAFARLPASLRSKYQLVIAGANGWGGLSPETWFNHYGIQQDATYLGRVSDAQLAALYQGATMFVFPSLYEGFGLPVLEALSQGIPVICARNSSLPEVAGEAAVYFESDNVDDLVDKLELVLENEDLRVTLSSRSAEQARQFSWDKAAGHTLEYLVGGYT